MDPMLAFDSSLCSSLWQQRVALTGASGCLSHHSLKLLTGDSVDASEVECFESNDLNNLKRARIEGELVRLKSGHNQGIRITWVKIEL